MYSGYAPQMNGQVSQYDMQAMQMGGMQQMGGMSTPPGMQQMGMQQMDMGQQAAMGYAYPQQMMQQQGGWG